ILNGTSLSWSDGPSRPASSRPAAGSVRKRSVITWPASTGSSISETAQRPLFGQRAPNLAGSRFRPPPKGHPDRGLSSPAVSSRHGGLPTDLLGYLERGAPDDAPRGGADRGIALLEGRGEAGGCDRRDTGGR